MLIVHISKSPLAGAPIRIVNALNKHTAQNARLINLSANAYGARTFPEDLIWDIDKEECLRLIRNADILHFHHYIDLESSDNSFGINFKETAPNAKFIRHYHTDLPQIAEWMNISQHKLLADSYQKIVIPHYPERTLLELPILPNILPVNNNELLPHKQNNEKIKIAFSSSSISSIYDLRWNTKGYNEVSATLKRLSKKLDFEYIEIINTPYEKAMQLKKEADIIIGDIVTGSYHLTELEGLSQGKVVLSYLDARSVQTFMNTFKTKDVPFVNVNLKYLKPTLERILNSKDLRSEIGEFSREWIEKYYNDEVLIQGFINIYNKVLEGDIVERDNYKDFPLAKSFLYNDIYDIKWEHNKTLFEKGNIIQYFIIKPLSYFYNKRIKEIIKNIFSIKKTKDKKNKIITVLFFKFKLKVK